MTAPPRLHPSLVLGAYAEPLVSGARVALFGDASTELAGALLDRGARLVHVYDADRVRALEAAARTSRRSLVHAPLPDDGDLGVRDGAFDVVLVPDLTIVQQPAALLATARRVLSAAGAALVASPNAEVARRLLPAPSGHAPLGYYELYDALALQFRRVRMLGQQPFVAYAIADLAADGEPAVSIDTSLAAEERAEPEWFVAIASDRDVRLEPYALVQVPLDWIPEAREAPLDESIAPPPVAPREEPRRSAELERERDRAIAQAREAEQRLDEERRRAERAQADVAAKAEELVLAQARAESVVEELERTRELRVEREREIATLEARVESLRGEVARERAAADEAQREASARPSEEITRRLAAVELERDRARSALDAATRERDARRHEVDALGRKLEAARGELDALRADRDAAVAARDGAAARVASLEAALAAPRTDPEVARLRRELAAIQSAHAEALAAAEAERAAEAAAYEARLGHQAKRIDALAAESAERARVGRELLALVEEARAAATPTAEPAAAPAAEGAAVADLQVRLDRLAADAARREADLTSARWTIAQLEQRLARAATDGGG